MPGTSRVQNGKGRERKGKGKAKDYILALSKKIKCKKYFSPFVSLSTARIYNPRSFNQSFTLGAHINTPSKFSSPFSSVSAALSNPLLNIRIPFVSFNLAASPKRFSTSNALIMLLPRAAYPIAALYSALSKNLSFLQLPFLNPFRKVALSSA